MEWIMRAWNDLTCMNNYTHAMPTISFSNAEYTYKTICFYSLFYIVVLSQHAHHHLGIFVDTRKIKLALEREKILKREKQNNYQNSLTDAHIYKTYIHI